METADDDATEVTGAGADGERAEASGRGVSPNQVLGLLIALIGLRIGLRPLSDNSFFTHLATGRLILAEGAVPSADPYSFTAFGEPWTVQSWGASVVFALLEDVGGLVGIRILVAATTMVLAYGAWRLTQPARTLAPRLLLVVPALAVGVDGWIERPLLFGLAFLVVVLLAADGEIDPRWLVPVLWIWVNVHGSYLFGLAAIGLLGVGRLLDRERPHVELRAGLWAVLGVALGALNPVGPKLLAFPFQLLGRREAFTAVVEWQAPTWSSWGERAFAVQLLAAVVLVAWRGRRWRLVLPTLVFGALALQSSRNIVQASIVLLPVMAVAARDLGSIDGTVRRPLLQPVRIAIVALAAVVATMGLTGPDERLDLYPAEAAAWMRDEGLLDLDSRVVSRDFVGNFLTVAFGPDEVRVYIDDRVDMYPLPIIEDYSRLLDPDEDYAAILERAEATAVLWDTDTELGDWIEDPANGWRIVHRSGDWLVALPT